MCFEWIFMFVVIIVCAIGTLLEEISKIKIPWWAYLIFLAPMGWILLTIGFGLLKEKWGKLTTQRRRRLKLTAATLLILAILIWVRASELSEREQQKIQAQRDAAAAAWAIKQEAVATEEAVSATAAATATREAELKLTQLIKVLGVDNVEYKYKYSTPGDMSGCRRLEARRITFSIENADTEPHSVEVLITVEDYQKPCGIYDWCDRGAEARWHDIVTPGRHQITFDGPGFTYSYSKERKLYFVRGTCKLLSVDGVRIK